MTSRQGAVSESKSLPTASFRKSVTSLAASLTFLPTKVDILEENIFLGIYSWSANKSSSWNFSFLSPSLSELKAALVLHEFFCVCLLLLWQQWFSHRIRLTLYNQLSPCRNLAITDSLLFTDIKCSPAVTDFLWHEHQILVLTVSVLTTVNCILTYTVIMSKLPAILQGFSIKLLVNVPILASNNLRTAFPASCSTEW